MDLAGLPDPNLSTGEDATAAADVFTVT